MHLVLCIGGGWAIGGGLAPHNGVDAGGHGGCIQGPVHVAVCCLVVVGGLKASLSREGQCQIRNNSDSLLLYVGLQNVYALSPKSLLFYFVS